MKKLLLLAWMMVLSIVATAQTIIVIDKDGNRAPYDPDKITSIEFQATPPGFTIYMDGQAISYTFDVVKSMQGNPNFVFVDPQTVSVDADGVELAVQVKANVDFEVASSPSWITFDTEAKDGQRYVKVAMNPSVDERTGTVTLTSKDGTLTTTLKIEQAGKEDSRYIDIDWEKNKLDSYDAETGVAVITFAEEVPVMGEYDVVMVPDELGTLMIRIIDEVTSVAGKTATLKTTQGDMGNLFRDQKLTFELGDDGTASARGVSGSKPVFRPEKVEILEDGKYVEVYNARGNRAPSTQELTLDYEGSDIMLESWGNLTFKIQKAKLAMKFKGTLEFSFERQPWYKVWKGHTTKASVLLEGDSEGETVLDISCRTPNEMSGNAILSPDDVMRLKTGVVQRRYTFNVEGVPVQVVLNGDVGCTHAYTCLGLGDAVGGYKYSKHFKYGLTCVDDNLDGDFIYEEKPTVNLIYPEANIGSAEYKTSQCYGRASVLPVFKINFYGQYCRTDICPAEWTYVHPRSWQPYPDEAPDAIARRVRVDRWANTYIAMKNIPGWLLDHSEGDNFSSDDEKTEILMYNPEDFTLETPECDLMQDDEQDIEITAFHYDHSTNEKLTSIGALVAFEIEGSASGDKKLMLKYTDENGKAKVTFKKGEPAVERVSIKLFRTPIKDKDIEKYVEKKWTSKLLKYNIQCLNPSQEVEKGTEAVPVHFLLQKTEGTDLSAWAHKRVEFVATNGTVTPTINYTDENGLITAYFTPTNSAPEGEVLAIVTEEGNKKVYEGRATGKIIIKGGSNPCETGDDDLNKADQQENTVVITNKTTGVTKFVNIDPAKSEWQKSTDVLNYKLSSENMQLEGHIPLTIVSVVAALTGQTFENTPGAKLFLGVSSDKPIYADFAKFSGQDAFGTIKSESKVLLRKPCNKTKPANARANYAPGDEEYTDEYELLFYLVFTNEIDGEEYEAYGKGTMVMHTPKVTSFVLDYDKDWVRVGESAKIGLTSYREEGATWDWNDVELVGQSANQTNARKGTDDGYFTWDAATQTLTSVKSNDNKQVWVYLGLKSDPSVKAPAQIATGEGWKYTAISTSVTEMTQSANSYFRFDFNFAPKGSENEKIDFSALELDPSTNPDGYFKFPYSDTRWPVFCYSNTPPGEYILRFWVKSNHDVNCTMKIIITP
jgi:hypothetical protein